MRKLIACAKGSSNRLTELAIVIDLRSLQNLLEAERGIASHTRNLVLRARDVSAMVRNARLTGIIDPSLPAVETSVTEIFDELRPNAYLPELKPGSLFLNPAAMSADQSFIARLLLNPDILKAAVVYDFIPYDDPARYLISAPDRLEYFTSMAWLKRYDVFLPISESTLSRLSSLIALNNRPSFITGVHVASWLEALPTTLPEPRHILAVAGGDPRKNPEVLIRAHATSEVLQARKIPLIIAGNYSGRWPEQFMDLYRQSGGDPVLLTVPGLTSEEVLLANYRQAFCVVTPSRAEGFSMPVVEAMAAGVPSIVSDIPAHAALVKDKSLRFGPDDASRLTTLLEQIVLDPDFRAQIVAGQSEVWPQFRAKTVAQTVWSGIEASMANAVPRSFGIGGHRPRVAMLTPLPPSRSGISDYSALLARSFDEWADLSLFSNIPIPGAAPISGMPHVAHRFDRVISVMGNSYEHYKIHDLLVRYGGACICHDSRLLGFSLSRFGLEHTARMASRELGRNVSTAEVSAWNEDEKGREADILGSVAEAAQPLIFHNRQSVSRVYERFGKQARYLPFALQRPWENHIISATARAAARDRLGIPKSQCVVASFGFIHPTKGIDAALRALALLRSQGAGCHLYWVGQTHHNIDEFKDLAVELDISELVHFTDRFFTEAEYRDYLLTADYGLQLRLGGRGNISGALSDCIAAGLPTVASGDLAGNVEAPSFIRRVDDQLNPVEIAAAFISLFETGISREDWSEERFAYCERHNMQNYTRGLCEILELDI